MFSGESQINVSSPIIKERLHNRVVLIHDEIALRPLLGYSYREPAITTMTCSVLTVLGSLQRTEQMTTKGVGSLPTTSTR